MVFKKVDYHFLYASTLFADRKPTDIQTVLGSCVAVCLFDPRLNVGGINHYMLPLWEGDGLATVKYGNIAIEKLIERMSALGSEKKSLVAKIFGGADSLGDQGFYGIGKRNIVVAQDILAALHIPVIASNVGGTIGRKILFNTGTGQVLMKFVNN